jgi:hypothetical protein
MKLARILVKNQQHEKNHLPMYRLEGRWLKSRDEIFETKNSITNSNFITATSVAIKFQRK